MIREWIDEVTYNYDKRMEKYTHYYKRERTNTRAKPGHTRMELRLMRLAGATASITGIEPLGTQTSLTGFRESFFCFILVSKKSEPIWELVY